MTLSDEQLARFISTLSPNGQLKPMLDELQASRRKLAAVEQFCEEWPQDAMPADLRAALAAGEAPTEPATCDMRGGEVYDFAWCETHDTTFALGDTCPGPVPQGGTA